MTTLVVLALANCGGAPETTSSPAGDSSGQTISVAGSPALRWGEGDYGVVLAHGAAFDAASWEEQAVAIADQGATVVAVEDIDSDAIRAAVELLQDQESLTLRSSGPALGPMPSSISRARTQVWPIS